MLGILGILIFLLMSGILGRVDSLLKAYPTQNSSSFQIW